jgi:hypothetical protein
MATSSAGTRALAALLTLLAAREARADSWWLSKNPLPSVSYSVPDAPAPPSLPDLTHRALWLGAETSIASIKPHDAITGPQPRQAAWVQRVEAEYAVSQRRWYLGAAYEAAYGKPPGGSDGVLLARYPEIWGRAVWASRTGLAYGGGLSLVVPIFSRSPGSPGAIVAEGVRVVRPWDFAPFAENTFTATPYLDARIIDGNVTLQLRQAFSLQGLVAEARLPKANVVSRSTLYLGYQPLEQLALGLEVWEVYFISADFQGICEARRKTCDDSLRAAFAVSPSLRFMWRTFQPAVSLLLPFDRTLFDEVASYWAVRLSLGGVFDSAEP